MILVLAGVGRSLRNVVGGDGLLSFSAFVGIYHQQLDEQFSISLSSQLEIKNIHPLAFARVVGGKHQTTAAKLKTQTKAKNQILIFLHIWKTNTTAFLSLSKILS